MDPLTSKLNAIGTTVDLGVSFAEDRKNTHNSVENMVKAGAEKRRAADINFLNTKMVNSQNRMQEHGNAQVKLLTGQQ